MNKLQNGRAPLWLFAILALICFLIFQGVLPTKRERAVIDTVRAASAEFGVPVPLVLAVIEVESEFDADARSDAGAMGYMQLLPDTFTWIRDEKLCETVSDTAILDPTVNIRYGTYYLAYLTERFGTLRVALAAYNAGEGRVAEWLETDPTLFRIPYPETRGYVDKVLRALARYEKKYDKTQEVRYDRQ